MRPTSGGRRRLSPRFVVGAAAVILVAAQLVPVSRTNPPVPAAIRPPADVRAILDRSCFDCHSNQTRWPWYAHAAPVSWFLADHVNDGRGNLNFSYWELLPASEQRKKAREVEDQLLSGAMPLRSYLLIHRNARLTAAEVGRLRAWFFSEEATPGPRADSLRARPAPAGGEWLE